MWMSIPSLIPGIISTGTVTVSPTGSRCPNVPQDIHCRRRQTMIEYNSAKPQFEDMEAKAKDVIARLQDIKRRSVGLDIEALDFAITFIKWGLRGKVL